MRTFAALSVGGVIGVMLLKLLASLLMPAIGVLIGLMVTAFKLLLFALVAYFIYSLVRKRKKEEEQVA